MQRRGTSQRFMTVHLTLRFSLPLGITSQHPPSWWPLVKAASMHRCHMQEEKSRPTLLSSLWQAKQIEALILILPFYPQLHMALPANLYIRQSLNNLSFKCNSNVMAKIHCAFTFELLQTPSGFRLDNMAIVSTRGDCQVLPRCKWRSLCNTTDVLASNAIIISVTLCMMILRCVCHFYVILAGCGCWRNRTEIEQGRNRTFLCILVGLVVSVLLA